jgi:hypothetical protein
MKRLLLGVTFILIIAATVFSQTLDNAPGRQYHIQEMYKHPWFWDVLAASAGGWVLGLVKGFSGVKDWIASYWPSAPLAVVFVLDLIVFVVVGAFVGTGIYNPSNLIAALAAGITWPVGLGSLTTKAQPPPSGNG